MKLFKKDPPTACPKCGKSDGWRLVVSDTPLSAEVNAASVNPFSTAPIRGSFGQNLTGMRGRSKKLCYHCNNCGYEKSY